MNDINSSDNLPNPLPVIETVEAALVSKTPDKFKFRQAKDGRGRVVPGIWLRNDRYYGSLRIRGKGCRRVSLLGENNLPVDNITEAKEAYRLVLSSRDAGDLPQAQRGIPLFSEFHVQYTEWAEKMEKKLKITVDKERRNLKRWSETLGTLPLNQITKIEIHRHLEMRKDEGCSNRTLNLDVIVLGNCLRHAREELGLLKNVVTEDIKPLEHRAPTRGLLTEDDVEKVCVEATKKDAQGFPIYAHGQTLSDYIHFMLFSGARRESAAFVKWEDVDFENRRVRLVKTKYSKVNMSVTFNPNLEKLLTEMQARKLESPWLFPNQLQPAVQANFRKTFDAIRAATKLEDFQFHDLRHFFISHAVMDGIPYLTIAQWVGHRDGGVLIGKVYGHLSDSHLQEAAAKLTFGKREPTFVETPAPSQAGAPAPQMVDLSKLSEQELIAALVSLKTKTPVAA